MKKNINKALTWFLVFTLSNLPWPVLADLPFGSGGVFSAPPPPSIPSKPVEIISGAAYIGSFADLYQQLQKKEAQAVDVMMAERPYRLKSKFLFDVYMQELTDTEWYKKIVKEIETTKPVVPTTLEPQKIPPAFSLPPQSTLNLLPEPQKISAKYVSLLEKLGLPSEANENAFLAKVAVGMESAGKELKVFAEKRAQVEKEVDGFLTNLQKLAETDSEKVLAMGADAIVTIRRHAGISMHTIIPELVDSPTCTGDLLKDNALFKYLDALVAGKRAGIVNGTLAVQKVLECADISQTLALDVGITMEWVRLHEVFADTKFDMARNRIREWLFGMALMVGDAHQMLGLTGTQALIQLEGNTSLVGAGSWLVRDGVSFYNHSTGALDHFEIRHENYVPNSTPPPAPLKLDNNFKAPGLDQNFNPSLVQVLADTKQSAQKPKPIILPGLKPFEYLDLTTPFGLTFLELQNSCAWHDPIVPDSGVPPRYSITDFITSAAADHVGMGLCSKKEAFLNGGYCKRLVCDPPEDFFEPNEPPMGNISNAPTCSLPMPGLMSECEVGQQINKDIHALVGNEGCPINPWMEEAPAPNDNDEEKKKKQEEEEKKKQEEEKKKNDKSEKPSGVPADATEWECTADGCSWYSPTKCEGGCYGVCVNPPGSGACSKPVSKEKNDVSDNEPQSKDPNTNSVSLPGDVITTMDVNAKGGDKSSSNVISKLFEKVGAKTSSIVKSILTATSKSKFKMTPGGFGPSINQMRQFNELQQQLYIEKMKQDFIDKVGNFTNPPSKADINLFSTQDLVEIALLQINGLKTFDDVEKVLKFISTLDTPISDEMANKTIKGTLAQEGFVLPLYLAFLERALEQSEIYYLYKKDIINRANQVLKDPKFNAAAFMGFAKAYGTSVDSNFTKIFNKALDQAIAISYQNTVFLFPKVKHILGDAHSLTGTIRLHLGTAIQESDKYNVPLRDVVINIQVHEMLHVVGFNLDAEGYPDISYPGQKLDSSAHVAMYHISMLLRHSIENYLSGSQLGVGYSDFDYIIYGEGKYVPPSKSNSSGGGSNTGKGGSGSGGSTGAGGFKDCQPGMSCGNCQMTSYKAAMAAKCHGALAIKNPVTPYTKPNPNGESDIPANDDYAIFMSCLDSSDDSGGSVPNNKCFNIVCSDPTNSSHECCKGKSKADPAAINTMQFYLKQCAAVTCGPDSDDPCCTGFSNTQEQGMPATSVPLDFNSRGTPATPGGRNSGVPPAPSPVPNQQDEIDSYDDEGLPFDFPARFDQQGEMDMYNEEMRNSDR